MFIYSYAFPVTIGEEIFSSATMQSPETSGLCSEIIFIPEGFRRGSSVSTIKPTINFQNDIEYNKHEQCNADTTKQRYIHASVKFVFLEIFSFSLPIFCSNRSNSCTDKNHNRSKFPKKESCSREEVSRVTYYTHTLHKYVNSNVNVIN